MAVSCFGPRPTSPSNTPVSPHIRTRPTVDHHPSHHSLPHSFPPSPLHLVSYCCVCDTSTALSHLLISSSTILYNRVYKAPSPHRSAASQFRPILPTPHTSCLPRLRFRLRSSSFRLSRNTNAQAPLHTTSRHAHLLPPVHLIADGLLHKVCNLCPAL